MRAALEHTGPGLGRNAASGRRLWRPTPPHRCHERGPPGARSLPSYRALRASPHAPSGAPTPGRVACRPDRIAGRDRRIGATRWPEIPCETGWSAGTDVRLRRDLARVRRRAYDGARPQGALNRVPHDRPPVEGERLHVAWYKGAGPDSRSRCRRCRRTQVATRAVRAPRTSRCTRGRRGASPVLRTNGHEFRGGSPLPVRSPRCLKPPRRLDGDP